MKLRAKLVSVLMCFTLTILLANTAVSPLVAFAEEETADGADEVTTSVDLAEAASEDTLQNADVSDGVSEDVPDTEAEDTEEVYISDEDMVQEALDADSELEEATETFQLNEYSYYGDETDDNSVDSGSEYNPVVTYRVHVQGIGDQAAVSNGYVAGTLGESKRLEAIWINVSDTGYGGGIEYRTHVQTYGWQNWVRDGAKSGTSGESKRLEAIQIRLYGEVANYYDVYYKVHAQTYGWLDWAKNGAPAGTAGQGKRLEAIQIILVKKGEYAVNNTACSYVELGKSASGMTGLVNYMTHVQTYGNQNYVCDGSISGTSGESKRLEQISIKLGNTGYEGGIRYKTHIQTYGWENDWKYDGAKSGTSGEGKRLEAIQIELYGEVAEHYDVYYRVHAQTFGWLDWACNGETAGTAGFSKRLEGIQIILVEKDSYSNILYNTGNDYGLSYVSSETMGDMFYSARVMLCTGSSSKSYMTKEQCDARMTTITVRVWDFESSNSMNKVTKMRNLTVNKAVANYYTKLFEEIYNSPDKPVIDSSLYAYTYRTNTNNKSVLSTHAYGVAIDINSAYNPNGVAAKSYEEWAAMPEGTIAQRQAKAKTLYRGCTIVNILRDKYGLYWGGDYGGTPDAMHFEFFS